MDVTNVSKRQEADNGRAALTTSVGYYHGRMSDVFVEWKGPGTEAENIRI